MLLILAGITISLTFGDNGLLRRAEQGRNAHERGEANDINAMDRATDYMNSFFTGKGGSGDTPDFDENEFTLGTNAADAQNTDKYGWKVPEYTVTTQEFTTGVWRLFYQDSNYTYLITDECVGNYDPSDYFTTITNKEGELKYQTGADVCTVGRKLSPIIDTFFISTNTNDNIRAVAWLTDTSNLSMWNEYKNNEAVFAIGAPTVELFAASYNNRSNKSNVIELGLETYGYSENTGVGWLSVNDNYGIYNKGTDNILSSPSDMDDACCWGVSGEDGYFGNSPAGLWTHSVRWI